MSAAKRVAVVTGSNKGVGFGIVRALCKQFDGDVILTSRDEGRGQKAVEQLQKEGLNPKCHQLDVLDTSSIRALRDYLKNTYGGLDLLVNNAGIAFKSNATEPFAVQAEMTLRTNFWAVLEVCEELFPLLRPHARVVTVSSFTSSMALKKCSPEIQANITDPSVTLEQIKQLMTDFESLAKKGTHKEAGWADWAYAVSKIGVRMLASVQQRQLDAEKKDDIVVNSCCPGYVDTDMTSHKGTKTIDEGAETPVMAALVPPNATSPRGEFLSEKKVTPW